MLFYQMHSEEMLLCVCYANVIGLSLAPVNNTETSRYNQCPNLTRYVMCIQKLSAQRLWLRFSYQVTVGKTGDSMS